MEWANLPTLFYGQDLYRGLLLPPALKDVEKGNQHTQ